MKGESGMFHVWKFDLKVTDFVVLQMPEGAKVLSVAERGEFGNRLDVWALVDPDAPMRERRFRVVGTGHPFPDAEECRFVGTVQTRVGLVWHLFESVGEAA